MNYLFLISLEKMLVDMYCDKLICGMYSQAEYAFVMEQALSKYQVDSNKLLRYARRRGKDSNIREYLLPIMSANSFDGI